MPYKELFTTVVLEQVLVAAATSCFRVSSSCHSYYGRKKRRIQLQKRRIQLQTGRIQLQKRRTQLIANGTNSIAKPTNSIANGTNSIAKATNSIANGMNSIAKSPNSIAKTCRVAASLAWPDPFFARRLSIDNYKRLAARGSNSKAVLTP